jgi:hypothetical protein
MMECQKTNIIPCDKRRKEIKGTAHGTKKNKEKSNLMDE